ncbi:glycogen debranching N-terminal domain-containing protein [Amycolatopsis sp. DSM 110486]|uniref:glycogen debranching N-terminal domain-containing protein n=1 Tax=Amycolatopsis sp. DSM 110486 TaxID=2865832 RepID=UPI001C6A382F|nr:glycogen debranching N-terminal domain-containing protein [Amycolatopsis sp. DSM 110486]QYN22369.1 amylo-alpha-1,6-glucosidase [Amycolatopsis sp. DSM 110486]
MQPLLHDLAIALRAPTVVLSGRDGQIRGNGTQGLLHGDLRLVSEAVVTVDGHEPEPIGFEEPAADRGTFTGLVRHLGNPGPDPTVWLRRHRRVTASGVTEKLELVSSASEAVECVVELALAADFASIEVIKSGGSTVPLEPVRVDGGVRWEQGLVKAVVATDGGTTVDGARVLVKWRVRVEDRVELHWTLTATDPEAPFVPGSAARLPTPVVEADDRRFTALLNRSLDDLDALLLAEREHPGDVFAGAGAPWFFTLFGRDSLWAARLALPLSLSLAGGTLRTLARAQGERHDPATGEAPGKILHERRRAGFEVHGMSLPARYYGTVDATALWVGLLYDAWRWGLPEAEVRALLPNLRAALFWITGLSDTDGDGFAEYLDESGRGLANQGWKDSGDAVRFADGTIAKPPVALSEVQGYQYEAAVHAAELLAALGEPADGLLSWAEALRSRFRSHFWVSTSDGHFPALALDGAKQPVDSLTSNIGHLLGTGILDPAESASVGELLLHPSMAAGFGLRTMSSTAGGFSPLSYHCGSVWPHDTAVVVRGLHAAGQSSRAASLGLQLVHAAGGFDNRLPELFSGYGSDDVSSPLPYPASCRPQAWAAASAVTLLVTFLGLRVDVPAGVVTLDPPRPSPVGALRVTDLPLAGGTLDVTVAADGTVTDLRLPPGLRLG